MMLLIILFPTTGSSLVIPMRLTPQPAGAPRYHIMINIPAAELTVYEDNIPLRHYPVAIGSSAHPTPETEGMITSIEWNPWWYPPESEWAKNEMDTPPGPKNPLGPVKIRLGGDILIHGTSSEKSVGRPVSHGCMRMYNKDAVDLAWFLQKTHSSKNDPTWLTRYQTQHATTFYVSLDEAIPVHLVYAPAAVKDGQLEIYPDHYRKLGHQMESTILGALVDAGISLKHMNAQKIKDIASEWKRQSITIDDLLLTTASFYQERTGPASTCTN